MTTKTIDVGYLLDAATSLSVASMIIKDLMERAPLGFKERNEIKAELKSLEASRAHILLIAKGELFDV